MDDDIKIALLVRLESIKRHLNDDFFKTYIPDEIDILMREIESGDVVPF